MSKFSDLCAESLLAALRQVPNSSRHLVVSNNGEEIIDIFSALLELASSERSFSTSSGADDQVLKVIDGGEGVVIVPYFSDEPPPDPPRPNRGSRGFASALRDHFVDGSAADELMILLVFDESPNETLLTTTDQSVTGAALQPRELLHLASQPPPGANPGLKRVLREIVALAYDIGSVSPDPLRVGQTAQAASALSELETAAQIGTCLYDLPWCLSDPNLFAHTQQAFKDRLERGAKFRAQLESWATDPTVDFDSAAREHFLPETAELLGKARTAQTVSWSEFTLDDLLSGSLDSKDKGDPPQFKGSKVTVDGASTHKLLANGSTVAATINGLECALTFELTKPLAGNQTLHVIGYDGASPPFEPKPLAVIAASDPPKSSPTSPLINLPCPRAGWSFLLAAITNGRRLGKNPSEYVRIALMVEQNPNHLVYGADGRIDLEYQAYSALDEITVITDIEGSEKSYQLTPSDDDGELIPVPDAQGKLLIPVIQDAPDDDTTEQTTTQSPEHLAIDAWKREELEPGELSTSLRMRPGNIVVADIGPLSRPIASVGMPFSRWEIEAHLIENPRHTVFRISESGAISVASDVEELGLGQLDEAFSSFVAARESFFSELAKLPVKSVIGADLNSMATVIDYLDSYRELIDSVPDDEDGIAGYDRIILSDAVISDDGEILLAPTSPIAVAAHRRFQQRAKEWTALPPSKNYFGSDISAVSIEALIPYLQLKTIHKGEWLESGFAPYGWRRYRPLTQRARARRAPSVSKYICTRIERFLDVYPFYAHTRRTLSLGFINPGPAEHVLEALTDLVGRRLKSLGTLPSFDLILMSDDETDNDVTGVALDNYMTLEPEYESPSVKDRDTAEELKPRLRYTKKTVKEFLAGSHSFVHILFAEDFFQANSQLISQKRDAHPSSVYAESIAADSERLARREPSATRFLSSTWMNLDTADEIAAIAARTTELTAAATGVPVIRGVVRALEVTVPDRIIPKLYDRAVWVSHVDRHVGLELFLPDSGLANSPYIIDYSEQLSGDEDSFDGITATSQIAPYEDCILRILSEALTSDSIPVPEGAADAILRTLNLISGRWGLEMLKEPDNVIKERIAVAIVAQVLEARIPLKSDPPELTLIVALDELVRVSGRDGLALGPGLAKQVGIEGPASDDLLLLTIPLATGRPQLRGRIVEVKFRQTVGDSGQKAAKQLQQTNELLTEVFGSESQPGRSLQGRHLAKIIFRYISRHGAYSATRSESILDLGSEAFSRIGAGDYDLNMSISRDGQLLCGDYASVEPSYSDAAYSESSATVDGIDYGRIRIGRTTIEDLLKGGHSSKNVVSETTTPADVVSGNIPGGENAEAQDGEGASGPVASRITEVEPIQETVQEEPTHDGDDQPGPKGQAPDDIPEQVTEASEVAVQSGFDLPPDELKTRAAKLDDVLDSFGLPLQPVQAEDAVCGPRYIRFRVKMGRGGLISQVESKSRDIERELGVEKPIMISQEGGFVTFDYPRDPPIPVLFSQIADAVREARQHRGQLPVGFGMDVAGSPMILDLAELPHLLVAGTTNSGKSVFLMSLIASLAMLPTTEVEVVLVDVKGLDFAQFASLPNLRGGAIIGSPADALSQLTELYDVERERRQKILSDAGARDIIDYYTRLDGTELTQIVVIIDEFANLIGSEAGDNGELEDLIQKYAEIMRGFGIYLVIATQRPDVGAITGRIKANLPARCAFKMPTAIDSVTILGQKGAEQLLGNGDMLLYQDGVITRLQAPLITSQEVLEAQKP